MRLALTHVIKSTRKEVLSNAFVQFESVSANAIELTRYEEEKFEEPNPMPTVKKMVTRVFSEFNHYHLIASPLLHDNFYDMILKRAADETSGIDNPLKKRIDDYHVHDAGWILLTVLKGLPNYDSAPTPELLDVRPYDVHLCKDFVAEIRDKLSFQLRRPTSAIQSELIK